MVLPKKEENAGRNLFGIWKTRLRDILGLRGSYSTWTGVGWDKCDIRGLRLAVIGPEVGEVPDQRRQLDLFEAITLQATFGKSNRFDELLRVWAS
jgi:hypothetical protein